MEKHMEQGTLDELRLTRSVIKHIKNNSKNTTVKSAVGNDYARMEVSDIGALITADGVAADCKIAWIKAMNNFITSGGKPLGVRISMLLPAETEESDIKKYMTDLNLLADSFTDDEGTCGIQIMGGNTSIISDMKEPNFCVTVIGQAGRYTANTREIKPSDSIIMTKKAGILGTNRLVEQRIKKLAGRFAFSYISQALYDEKTCSIWNEGRILSNREDVYYMHDVSFGGVYGALWQLGQRVGSKKGIKIIHEAIPIRQETIEFCEYFDMNPYQLDGTGALLAIAEDGRAAVDELREAGIEAAIIGEITPDNKKIVCHGEEIRFLTPIKGDEINKVI